MKTFHFVDIVAVLAAALVLATITFYGVERPFLLWRHRQRRSLAPASSPQSLP